MKIGIVGLPNVGKSTLFNALLKQQTALVANYPFATIEPNVGVVPVPDERLKKLQEIEVLELAGPAAGFPPASAPSLREGARVSGALPPASPALKLPPIVPATVSFIDIAGLVKGASEGEGLGNKFLSHIREVDAIVQVLRYFEGSNIHHISGSINPQNDKEVIEAELIIADLQTLESVKGKAKSVKSNNSAEAKEFSNKQSAIEKLEQGLKSGKLAIQVHLTKEEQEAVKQLQLLTMKPMFYIANVSEGQLGNEILQQVQGDNYNDIIQISAKVEQELAELQEEDQAEYLRSLGLEKSGLERVIQKGYKLLGLISFLTAGEKEVRAWTVKKSSTAVEAAGVIHTDFMKAFIKAEVISFEDFVQFNGRKGAREAGKARLEGKDYVVKDGDVIEFKIGK